MRSAVVLIIAGWVSLTATAAQAYVGPALGVSALGVIVGIVLSILVAFTVVFWRLPKRIFSKGKNKAAPCEPSSLDEATRRESDG